MFFKPLTWRGCLSQAAITMSLPRGALHEGGAPLAPFHYITNWEDPGGGLAHEWGHTLLAHARPDARRLQYKRGVDEDVHLACPGTDPLGIMGYQGAVLLPHRGVNNVAAQAPPPLPPPVAGQVCQGTLWEEGDARWPSLPPTMTTVPASPMVPTTASRRQRRAAAAQRRQDSGRAGRVGGHTGCWFLGRPSGGFWDTGGWRGCIP